MKALEGTLNKEKFCETSRRFVDSSTDDAEGCTTPSKHVFEPGNFNRQVLGSQLECQFGVMTAGECIKVEGGKLLGKVRISVQPRVFWECWPGSCKYLQPPGELQRSHLTSLLLATLLC